MNKPLINILVRTSNRPNFFAQCYKSIREQTYKNIRLIVSYDDQATKKYLVKYTPDAMVGFRRLENLTGLTRECFWPGYISRPFPANLYFNRMMEHTRTGYIVMLDDDNRFSSPQSLKIIAERIEHDKQMLFWRVQFPGYLIPENSQFGQPPQCCQIDTAGFAFHTGFMQYARWDAYSSGDYRTAMSLFLRIPEKVYINKILTALQQVPGLGLRKDLPLFNTLCHAV